MSIARPTTIIRRAAALPMGLLDRVDARLDAGFTRVDGALDRRIAAAANRSTLLSQALARSANSLDRALDLRVSKFDSNSAIRVAKTSAAADRVGSIILNLESRTDAKLSRGLHKVDRTTAVGTRAAVATINASVALTHRVDNKIARGFDRVDVRATNVANRAYRRQAKTVNLIQRTTSRIDQRIETDFARADARVNAGINHTVNTLESTVARAISATNATDVRVTNSVARIDTRINRRIAQGARSITSGVNLMNSNALAFEHAMDLGISRIDSRIANGQARAIATSVALTNGINSADQTLTGALTRVDYRLDKRIAQATYVYAQAGTIAVNRVAVTDTKLDATVSKIDVRVATGVAALVAAANGVSSFVTDHLEDADTALTVGMSRVDAQVETFISLTRGPDKGSRSSLPWAATSLTLVLGTLGAATGASVVNAGTVTGELDTSVAIEATAAKDAVTQYLSVRDSFQALQASRSRTIQTLEEEIAAAQERASQASIDGAQVIDIADNYGGVPYVRGGTTPSGFDCSGYTSYVFAQMGIDLPRVASAQYSWADKISAEDRKPGDLMFWSGRGGVYHVAIYAGKGKMWDSPRPGRRVGKISIWGSPVYGRVPIEALNAPAMREVKDKTAELEKLKANPPQLPIVIDENLLQPLASTELTD